MNKILTCLIILSPFLSSCTNDNKSDKRPAVLLKEEIIEVLDFPACVSNCTKNVQNIKVSKEDIIVLDDFYGKALLSQISPLELSENYIVLIDREKLFCYSLPDGQLLGYVDAKGHGHQEYNHITSATISNDKKFHILISKWQSSHSDIKIYNMENDYINSIQLPNFFGDLYCVDSASYILTGAVNTSGGLLPIIKYNLDKPVNLDTIFIGKYIEPRTTFFQTRKIYKKHPSLYYFESGDTIYTISRKNPNYPHPVLYLDYRGLKLKNQNKPLHENKDFGILVTDLSFFENNIYVRAEWNHEIYYFIYDILNKRHRYNLKVDSKAKEYGVSFNIEESTFCSWPISYWNGNLLFPIPDYIMSEIFGSESNPGLLKLSVEDLTK